MADEPEIIVEEPRKYAGKYDSPEALESAYSEVQAEMNRMRSQSEQERAQFAAALEAIPAQQEPRQQSNGGFDPDVAAYEQAYERGDTASMLRIQGEIAARAVVPAVSQIIDSKMSEMTPAIEASQAANRQAAIERAEAQVAEVIGADTYRELLPTLRTLIADKPNYLPSAASSEGYAEAILDVVKIAQHDKLVSDKTRLEQEIAEKQSAQIVSGGGSRSVYTQDEQAAFVQAVKDTKLGTFAETFGK